MCRHFSVVVLLLCLMSLLSLCHGQMIDHVTGCPNDGDQFTYNCTAGMLVTITSLSPDFHHWDEWVNKWAMTVEKLPCTNNTIVNDYQAACNLPAIPASLVDADQVWHQLLLLWSSNTSSGFSSTNVFYAVASSGDNTGSSDHSSSDDSSSSSSLLGLTHTAAIVVQVVATGALLAALGLLLWLCRGRVNCWRAAGFAESATVSESYSTLE